MRFAMEEDTSSMISNGKTNVDGETSDSYNSNFAYHANKRMRHESNASLAKFKGVVPQQNGHWGAQIYANHQRIWLGTFKSEKEAAMAYDSAAIRLRSEDSHRNFPWTDCNIKEPNFQNHYSTDVVLDMIRDGSYQSKFANFLRTQSEKGKSGVSSNQTRVHGNGQFSCTPLFQKELTPSDVGKLNRLVIPKKYAIKYFPCICENVEENCIGGGIDDTELVFYDKLLKAWKFRYCYWRSSQSFVFTRGWNRFVKAKELKTNDIITFYTCESLEMANKGQTFCLIDVGYNGGENENEKTHMSAEGVSQNVEVQVELQLNLGTNVSCKIDEEDEEFKEEKGSSTHDLEVKGIRLFGVQIN